MLEVSLCVVIVAGVGWFLLYCPIIKPWFGLRRPAGHRGSGSSEVSWREAVEAGWDDGVRFGRGETGAGPGAAPAEGDAMTWDEAVKRLEGARLNYVAAVWRGAGFDPKIAEELDDIAAALRLLLANAAPRADREQLAAEFAELENQIASLRHIANGNKGMGANITIEHAGRIPGQLRRLRRLLKLDEEGPDA